jgi:hypothetical protein
MRTEDPARSGGAGSAGTTAEPNAGGRHAAGGGEPAAGGLGAAAGGGNASGFGGMSGSGAMAGVGVTAGSGGDRASPELPAESTREREILAPLATSDGAIDGANGDELFELARAIGLANGYALCRCGLSPSMPPADIEDVLRTCASVAAVGFLLDPDESRCLEDGAADVPGFFDHLRCWSKSTRDHAFHWARRCTEPEFEVPPAFPCEPSPEVDEFKNACRLTIYCADDTPIQGFRCDQRFDCSDQSDEHGCFESGGYDWFWCDPELVYPPDLCRAGTCGLEKEPPVCDPMQPDSYLCDDRSVVSSNVVCDRNFDCPDNSDERYCVK